MKRKIILSVIIFLALSCKEEPYQLGVCDIYYYSTSGQTDFIVKVTDQDSVSLQYTVTPSRNIISLPLEAGDRYILETAGTRIDSIYNIRFVWSDNSVIYYSFMFNDIVCDMNNNRIRIDL